MARRSAGITIAVALVFGAIWLWLNPPIAHLPTSDLYGHLSVARHLARGEGFLNDVVYPLSLAFPHTAAVPQPLIHRGPAYPLLLTGTVWIGGYQPQRILAVVRWLHVLMLTLMAWLGLNRFHREGHVEASVGWLLLLGGSPLLAMSIGWGYIEVPAALLLLGLWLRWRSGGAGPAERQSDAPRRSPSVLARGAAVDGIMAAVLTLLRLDLFWIPIAWWLAKRRHTGWRAAAIGLAVWLLLLVPWAARSVHLTEEPFFSLQTYGEHLKQTPEWPEYAIYRSLEPEAFWTTVTQRPGIVLAKSVSGLRFFLTQLGHWLPWIVWAACLLLLARAWRSQGLSRSRNRFWSTDLTLPLLTLALLMLQYAIFSHTLRHLLVLLPIVTWEICLASAGWLRNWRPSWHRLRRAGLLTAVFLASLILTPPRLPGWENARLQAESSADGIADAAAGLQRQPGGPIFTDCAALLWLSDRAGVWSPLDREVEAEIRRRVPIMARAPTIQLLHQPTREQDLQQ